MPVTNYLFSVGQINAQIMQLSEGTGSYLPQFVDSAPSNKCCVGRVNEWLNGVN